MARILSKSCAGKASAPKSYETTPDSASRITGRPIMLLRKEGVQLITSTRFPVISLASAAGLWISSSVAMQMVMPPDSGMNSSMTDTSKVMAARARDTCPRSV